MNNQGSNEQTYLSSEVTVKQYGELENNKDKAAIAHFFERRMKERYFTPLEGDKKRKNGFTIMAVSCLTIETLQSFREGWKNSKGKSKKAIKKYFDRHESFEFLQDRSGEFYKHVRCGILHQGETTGGWHIRRDGPVFESTWNKINATKFHRLVQDTLELYCVQLRQEDWDSKIWNNFRKRMAATCLNCQPES